MTSAEERMQILRMIEGRQITAEEGARLLVAMETKKGQDALRSPGSGKWFRVRVTDMKTGRRKVNVNIPMGLVNIGAKIGAKFAAPLSIDIDEILAAIKEGAEGKIVDVEDEEDGERVEVFID